MAATEVKERWPGDAENIDEALATLSRKHAKGWEVDASNYDTLDRVSRYTMAGDPEAGRPLTTRRHLEDPTKSYSPAPTTPLPGAARNSG